MFCLKVNKHYISLYVSHRYGTVYFLTTITGYMSIVESQSVQESSRATFVLFNVVMSFGDVLATLIAIVPFSSRMGSSLVFQKSNY